MADKPAENSETVAVTLGGSGHSNSLSPSCRWQGGRRPVLETPAAGSYGVGVAFEFQTAWRHERVGPTAARRVCSPCLSPHAALRRHGYGTAGSGVVSSRRPASGSYRTLMSGSWCVRAT